MLYAAQYEERGLSRREEGQLQRRLARALLGLALRREFSLELDALPMERGPQGKPYFPGAPVEFSLSHCPGMVCAGLSAVPLGVDVQPARPYSQRLARRICTPEELAWLEGSPRYFLQNFVDSGNLIGQGYHGFSPEELRAFAERVRPFFGAVTLRGVE